MRRSRPRTTAHKPDGCGALRIGRRLAWRPDAGFSRSVGQALLIQPFEFTLKFQHRYMAAHHIRKTEYLQMGYRSKLGNSLNEDFNRIIFGKL
jgi:hypothetical protein